MRSTICLAGLVLPVLSAGIRRSSYSDAMAPPLVRRFDLGSMELEELRPAKPLLSKRADDVSLRDSLSLLWSSRSTSASLDAHFNGTHERVVNMDAFSALVSAVDCTPPELSLDFVDQASFDAATEAWGWIDEDADNHFIIILDMPQCGAASGWVPYNVTDVRYDTDKWVAYLAASEVTYESAIHDGHLTVETLAVSDKRDSDATTAHPVGPRRRASISRDIDLANSYRGSIVSIPLQDVVGGSLGLSCTDCRTAGTATLRLDVSISWFKVRKAAISLTTHGVATDVNLELEASAKQSVTGKQALWTVQAVGVSIPGIVRLGFGPEVGIGWDVTVAGQGKIGLGARGTLTPVSEATLCFTGCDTGSKGWEVSWETRHPSADGTLGADVNLSTYLTLSAAASIFSLGYEGGVAVVAPSFRGSVTAMASQGGGVCGGDKSAVTGVDTRVEIGAEAYAYIGQNYLKTDKRWDFFSRYAELDKCFAF